MTQWCQVCWNHRSRFRRRCKRCWRLVAPGCWPEKCLAEDGDADENATGSVCKDCWIAVGARLAPKVISRDYNESQVPAETKASTDSMGLRSEDEVRGSTSQRQAEAAMRNAEGRSADGQLPSSEGEQSLSDTSSNFEYDGSEDESADLLCQVCNHTCRRRDWLSHVQGRLHRRNLRRNSTTTELDEMD